ncbi:MAG: decaprenyl-phosphate phosphoribosyltransferase [Chloroflexi bacterium]|nr:decaprenyl-phosphate phosphoribosyltransferase [Chloroflexota bacterium]MCI0576440.1 decaprenyl-phosphate phosphoribosyltransferase [Chloroflexota bacterium]MCI0648199.1 decaprenyl-phosphate phosphoribosyltransferase [Chloroflexota bacterium]MCI0729584.1 decaprenyl-phosphate phosphoribosyltransferase [Chloroflexota bacterium]
MLLALLKTMRPRQWTKNGFVYAALIFDRQLLVGDSLLRTTMAFVLLCFMSSAVYIMNDLADIESDREHPTKRNRPLPSGRLSPAVAGVAAVFLAAGSLVTGLALSPKFGAILLAYLVMQIAYTFWLKQVVLLDVSVVATGFILRVAAGVAVINPVERFSPWLYVCTGLGALFLALGKRRHELVLLGQGAGSHRAILDEYNLDLLDRLIGVVTTSALVAYSLYTFLAEGLPPNHLMMLTIPFILYGLFRYLYLIHVRHEGGEPEEILLHDRPLQIDLALWLLMVLIALYYERIALAISYKP